MPHTGTGQGKCKTPAQKRMRLSQLRIKREPCSSSDGEFELEPDAEEEEEEEEDELQRKSRETPDSEVCRIAQEIDEKICEFFEQNSLFYDQTHESYKDKTTRDNILAEFATVLGQGWTAEKVWSRFRNLRTDYGKIKGLIRKSGCSAKKLTRKQQWKLSAFQFLEPYCRKGATSSQEAEPGQITAQPDEDDDEDISYPDDSLMAPSTSASVVPSQRSQQGNKPSQEPSDMVLVLKEILASERARESDARKTMLDLVKMPDARQAWAAWFASVCQDIPQERFREFQQETFAVSMRYLQQGSQDQSQPRTVGQPLAAQLKQELYQPPSQQQAWQPSTVLAAEPAQTGAFQPPIHQ